jgi:hypothetical protein
MKHVVIAGGLIPLGLAITGQQPPQFRTSTSLVRLEVAVTNERGAVRALRPEEFEVLDSGSRQAISVEESTDVPLDLVLVAQPVASVAYTSLDLTRCSTAGLRSRSAECR